MLSGEDNAGERRKNNNRSNQQKSNFARAAHFFVHFFTVVLHNYSVKLQETSWLLIHGGNVTCVLVHFLTAAHFYLGDRQHLLFSQPPLQNFHVVLPTRKCLLCLLSLTLFLVELRQPVAYFLFFSLSLYSRFVDITIFINLSLILQTTRIQKQFPLYKTQVAMRFPAKIVSSCIRAAIPVD